MLYWLSTQQLLLIPMAINLALLSELWSGDPSGIVVVSTLVTVYWPVRFQAYRFHHCCHQWRSQKFSTGGASICSIPFCPFSFSCPTKSAVQSKNVMTHHTAWTIDRTMIDSWNSNRYHIQWHLGHRKSWHIFVCQPGCMQDSFGVYRGST